MATNYIPKIIYNSTTIQFDFPNRKDPFGEEITHVGKVSTSKSGEIQTLTDHITATNNITFSFLTDTVKSQLETFLITWGMLGKSFDYYTDGGDITTKKTVTLDPRSFRARFKVISRKGSGFLWELQLKFREVIT